MTVDELLERMSLTEFVRWIAYYSDDKRKQAPGEIRDALSLSLAAGRKKKR